MPPSLQEAIEFNRDAHKTVRHYLSVKPLPINDRYALAFAYIDMALEHQSAITTLVEANIRGSAFALARPQIETAFRGLYADLICTDEEVRSLRENYDAHVFPNFKEMTKSLDQAYGADGWIEDFYDRWSVLCDFTHTGLGQLSRRFIDGGNIGPNYPDREIIELLALSGTVAVGTTVPLLRILRSAGDAEVLEVIARAEAIENWFAGQPFSLHDKPMQ
jgi:hypothetical protein